ncbi:MAG: hypothetical protein AABZ00_11485, partial [Chloroflexota bacterium]
MLTSNLGTSSTIFVGAHYKLTNGTVTKHYFAGTSRIATSKYTTPEIMKVEYLLSDHVSTSSTTTSAPPASPPTKQGQKSPRCAIAKHPVDKPFGEVRSWWTSSAVTAPSYAL